MSDITEALTKLEEVCEDSQTDSESDAKVDSSENDEKHIRRFKETEDSYIVEFGKSNMEEAGDDEDENTPDEMAGQDEDEQYSEETDNLNIQSELKAEESDSKEYGYFEGYGSIFGNTDLGNDVIQKGAFTKSLKDFRGPESVKLLYQHKSDMPIGKFDEIYEDSRGLVVKGRLALKTQAGAEAYELLKMGALDGLSIGFKVNQKAVSYEKDNRRIIKEVQLMEVSLVTFPMNPRATVRSVKGQSISAREWEKGLRDAFQLSRSEAKIAASAVCKCFDQRDVETNAEVLDEMKNLIDKFKL